MCKVLSLVALAGLGLCVPAWSGAQTLPPKDVTGMSVEDLLNVEVVSTASKFPQEVREAPASITVVTASDIKRYGHRTLSDVLRSVRGLYTTYDRNYSYIGVRGLSRPGDYNTRVLLLLDGHRLNDAIYDMAPIGTDYPIDVSLIERVEVIRGPSSSLYGTNALAAVINVVTRSGAQHAGLRADAYGGSQRTRGGTASYGRLFGTDGEFLVSGTDYRTSGVERLHFPEFDTGEPGSGTAVKLDRDRATSLSGSVSFGHFSLRGGVADRHKHVPTASFGSVFGDERLTTTDRRGYLSGSYEGALGRGWSGTARLAYDYYYYNGDYPFDYGESEPVLWRDSAETQRVTGELTARRRFARIHLVTIGTEVRRDVRNYQGAVDDFGVALDVNRPGTILGVYAQDEIRVFPWMIVNAGIRVDRYRDFSSRPTPRAAVVFLPRKQTAIKLLHGRAFRAPNNYELYYYGSMNGRALQPERMQSTEAVWEEYISSRVRTAVTAFTYKADRMIEQRAFLSGSDELYFANVTTVKGHGVEAEVEAKLPGGLNGHVSHAYVRTHEDGGTSQLSNSPRHLSKVGLQIPLAAFYLGIDGQYIGERLTLGGTRLKGIFVPNVTLTSPEGRRLELSVSAYNAFATRYADPGAEEHLQQSIPQDGRTLLARVRVRF